MESWVEHGLALLALLGWLLHHTRGRATTVTCDSRAQAVRVKEQLLTQHDLGEVSVILQLICLRVPPLLHGPFAYSSRSLIMH